MLHRRVAIAAALVLSLLVGPAIAPATAQEAPPGGEGGRLGTPLSTTPLTPSETVEGYKSLSSRVAESDPELVARQDAARVPVVIKFDYDGIASYRGGIAGVPATSPSATGQPLTRSTAESSAYALHVENREGEIVAGIQAAVPTAAIGQRLRVVYGGVAARIPANRADDLLQVDGVVAVQTDDLRQLQTDSSTEFVGAPPVWASLGGQETAGAGIVFGSLDSGTWPEHPSFADNGNLPPAPTDTEGGPSSATSATTRSHRPPTCSRATTRWSAATPSSTPTTSSRAARCTPTPLATATATAPTPPARRPAPSSTRRRSSASTGARSPAWPPAPPSSPTRCAASRAASAPTRWPPWSRPSSTASTSSTTPSAAATTRTPIRWSWRSSTPTPPGCSWRPPPATRARALRPPGTCRAGSPPWPRRPRPVSSGPTSRSPPATATRPGPRRLDRPGVASPLPVVLASEAPYNDVGCDTAAPAGIFVGKIVACQRGPGSRRSAPSTPSRAAPRRSSSTTRRWPTSRPTTTSCPWSTWPTARSSSRSSTATPARPGPSPPASPVTASAT